MGEIEVQTGGFHPTTVVEVETEYMRELKRRRAERYLRGPIRISDIHAATKLGGSCLALLVAIHHRITVTGRDAITLPSQVLSDFGVSRNAKARGLKNVGGGWVHHRPARPRSFGSGAINNAHEETSCLTR